MKEAAYFVHPMKYTGDYLNGYWAGYRFKDVLGYIPGFHVGVDYNYGAGNADLGMPALSVANGVVEYVNHNIVAGFGRIVVVKHKLNARLRKKYGVTWIWSRYFHLKDIRVKVGQLVNVAQSIGTVGNTGTLWAHMHCAISKATGRGYYDYPANVPSVLAKYYDTWKFINANSREAEQMDKLRKENAVLRDQVNKRNLWLKNKNTQIENLNKRVGVLKTANTSAAERISELETDLESAAKALEIEKGNMSELKAEFAKLEKRLTECEAQIGTEVPEVPAPPETPEPPQDNTGDGKLSLAAALARFFGAIGSIFKKK